MTKKEIIDQHFSSNYDYYQSICYKYCRGNDIHKDLLHKAYEKFLELREDVVLKFHALNRLYNLGLRIIRSIYQKRYQVKKNKQSSTSELFMLSGNFDISDYVAITSHLTDGEDDVRLSSKLSKILSHINESESSYGELDYLDLEKSINELLIDPDKTVGVTIFLQANEVSINKLSRDSNISRYYLTRKYEEGLNNLKNHIKNEQIKSGNTRTYRSEPGNLQVLDKTKRKAAA